MSEEGITISRQDAEDIANILSTTNSCLCKKISDDIKCKLGGWKPLVSLTGAKLSTADVIELRSLDGKTASIAIMVNFPGQDPTDCIALLEDRDGSPCFVPYDQYSGWRPYEFNDNNG
jgi:hypothetical protein